MHTQPTNCKHKKKTPSVVAYSRGGAMTSLFSNIVRGPQENNKKVFHFQIFCFVAPTPQLCVHVRSNISQKNDGTDNKKM